MNIELSIPVKEHTAMCDFCGQNRVWCFMAPNSAGDKQVDICRRCVEKIAAYLEEQAKQNGTTDTPATPGK